MVAEDRRAYLRRGGSGGSSLATGAGSDVEAVVGAAAGVVEIAGGSVALASSVSCSTLARESVTSPTSYRVTDARGPLRSREGDMETGARFIGMIVYEKLLRARALRVSKSKYV